MPTPIISVENLSKRYLVGHRTERGGAFTYLALRDVLAQEMRNAARKAVDVVRGRQVVQGDSFEEFWALRDVSFEVQQGEVLGIIGRNGAGKSTLLKLLSRITAPTRGRITLRGRVASLLEVGTGFHPELTGRENIYLNGAILGMSRAEIRKKFDEIVAFAEIEQFLDTPVKRYSSGMYVRLAFAVAAHLEPEILIVDEVLAVGDAGFQRKCLGKMEQVSRQGRTVLFVSHNMDSILQMTERAVLLCSGHVVFIGDPQTAIHRYESDDRVGIPTEYNFSNMETEIHGTGEVKIMKARFERQNGRFSFNEPVKFVVEILGLRAAPQIRASVTVWRMDGTAVGTGFTEDIPGIEAGEKKELSVTMQNTFLAPGSYYCSVGIGKGNNFKGWNNYAAIFKTLYFDVMAPRTPFGLPAEWHPWWGSISFEHLIGAWEEVLPRETVLRASPTRHPALTREVSPEF